MYREIRKSKLAITDKERLNQILADGEYGVMSSVSEDGQPYGVPLNYLVMNDHIYFHAAKEGHKLDNIAHNNKVSFLVVGGSKVVSEQLTTQYHSVVVYGKASLVEDEREKKDALLALVEKYCPAHIAKGIDAIKNAANVTAIVKISIDHITGKDK